MERYLIVNADDLGHAEGINRGIEECHRHGLVTSASLMVNRPATSGGVAVARRNPGLSVGLHVNVTDEHPDTVDLNDAAWIARELSAQYASFCTLLGHAPTHLDSHHHIHRASQLTGLFQAFARRHRLPLRHYSAVRYEGGFYGQWEPGVTDLGHVRAGYLCALLRGLRPGVTELACHPGFVSPDLVSIYSAEREEELRALTSAAVKRCLAHEAVVLCNFTTRQP